MERTTYSGSGLPYSNPDIAFDNSPNKGAVKVINGKFTFNIHYPNSFYAGFGKHLITPHVYYKLCNKDTRHPQTSPFSAPKPLPLPRLPDFYSDY